MFTPAQLEALQAAIDVAFDGTPTEETERLEMERQARAGFAKVRELTDLPAPSSKRCRLVTSATKSANVLASAKLVMRSDPQHKVVFMPEIDYVRLWAQVNRLEAQYKVMLKKLQAAQDEIDDLQHVPAEYEDMAPEVEALTPVPLTSGADFDRPLGAVVTREPEIEGITTTSFPSDLPAKTPFEAHMDRCERCGERGAYREKPMGVCPIGAALLKKEGTLHA